MNYNLGSEIEFEKREEALKELRKNGYSLRYVNRNLRGDFEVVMTAVKQDGYALEFASDEMRNDKRIAMEVVKNDGYLLQLVGSKMRNDREVVMTAVKQSGVCIPYVSEELRNDKEIILEVVRNNSGFLQYASEELRNDLEVALVATKRFNCDVMWVSDELREKYGKTSQEFISNAEKEFNKLNNTDSNEVSFEKLDKLNEKNKELLKECTLTKEDVSLPNINSKYKTVDTLKDNNVNEKKEVKTSNHKQR
jgi:hypothetical protein